MVECYGEENDNWDSDMEDDWNAAAEEYEDPMSMIEETKLVAKNSSGLGDEKVFMAGHMKNKYYSIIDSNEIHTE